MELMIPTTDDLSAALKAMLDEVANELCSWSDSGVTDAKVEEIPHDAYDGFVPWTNGGYTGIAYVNFQDGKDSWKAMETYAKNDDDMLDEEFRAKLRKELDEDGVLDETIFDTMPSDELRETFDEQFEEVEQDWRGADTDTFFLKFRAMYYAADNRRNKSGEDEIYFFAGVNTDFNYGRDSISWMPGSVYASEWEMNVPVSQCSPEKITEIKAAMIAYFRKA